MVFGLGWWVHPGPAAEMLGATLLEGTGRTAQIGDTGAFFVGAGMMLAWGAIRGQASVLLAGGLLSGWWCRVEWPLRCTTAAPGHPMRSLPNVPSPCWP